MEKKIVYNKEGNPLLAINTQGDFEVISIKSFAEMFEDILNSDLEKYGERIRNSGMLLNVFIEVNENFKKGKSTKFDDDWHNRHQIPLRAK